MSEKLKSEQSNIKSIYNKFVELKDVIANVKVSQINIKRLQDNIKKCKDDINDKRGKIANLGAEIL